MKSRTLTLKQLRDAGAWKSQCDLFRSLFGESVKVTARRAASFHNVFDWQWAARNLLSLKGLARFDVAVARADQRTIPMVIKVSSSVDLAKFLALYSRAVARAFAHAYIAEGEQQEKAP